MSTTPTDMPRLNGFKVMVSDGGCLSPVRKHRKSANQAKASYHRRIQKKWTKRFGTKWVEIQKRGEVFKLGSDTVVIRREDWLQLQTAIPLQRHAIR